MWNLPGPGIKPVLPALACGFLSTVPPGKSPLSTVEMPGPHPGVSNCFVWGRAQKSGLAQTSPAYSKLKPELLPLLGWSPAAQCSWHRLGASGMQSFRPTPDLLQGQSLHPNGIPRGAPMPTEGQAALG